MIDLARSWIDCWNRLGISRADMKLFEALLGCYAEPHRHYHTQQHLNECMALHEAFAMKTQYGAQIGVALWFHDAIYDVFRHDNEERSAKWACQSLQAAGCSAEISDGVGRLILATRHRAEPKLPDEQLLVDIDLSILGSDPIRFDQYEGQIRKEYHYVPDFLYRSKRKAVLESFLNRSSIFSTDSFVAQFETQARSNMERSIGILSA